MDEFWIITISKQTIYFGTFNMLLSTQIYPVLFKTFCILLSWSVTFCEDIKREIKIANKNLSKNEYDLIYRIYNTLIYSVQN